MLSYPGNVCKMILKHLSVKHKVHLKLLLNHLEYIHAFGLF